MVTQSRFFVPGGLAVGAPQPGVDVVSIGPDNTVGDVVQTDSTGRASLRIAAGGSVTAIYHHPTDLGADLVTYLGAQPRDVLTFGQRFSSTSSNPVGTMTFSFPPVMNATLYQVLGPCDHPTSTVVAPLTLHESEFCHHDPMDLIFVAFSNTTLLGYNTLRGVAFQSGSTVALSSWVEPTMIMVNMTGLPSVAPDLNYRFIQVGNGEQAQFDSAGTAGKAVGGAYSASHVWAPSGIRTQAQLNMIRAPFAQTVLLDVLPPDARPWTVTSPPAVPWLQTSSANLDQISMVTDGPGTYSAAVVQVTWTHVVGATSTPFAWTFVVPPPQLAFGFPPLPPQFAGFAPQPADALTSVAHLIEIPSVAGYDQLRAMPENSLICPKTLVPDCALRNGEIDRVIFSL